MIETDETEAPLAGERLRAAREEKGLSLEDIAAQTRIPRRHLESIEIGDWSKLPAPTYTIGFAKSYASAVGLDRAEIGDQLRAEIGGERPTTTTPEVFEPADPARTMPKWLVLGAIAAVIALVLLLSWLNERSLEAGDEAQAPVEAAVPADTAPAVQEQAQATGPVVITAAEQVWVQIRDGAATLREGIMEPGQRFEVPVTAAAPVITTGKPEALRITVGTATAPSLGPPATTVRSASLKPEDLMRAGAAATTPSVPAPSAPPGVQNTAG